MAARFDPPVIQDNPTGWGPNSIPEKYRDMPYQPFSKSDRIGKVTTIPAWLLLPYQNRKWPRYCPNDDYY
jgi:translation initiation factor 3 subunit D